MRYHVLIGDGEHGRDYIVCKSGDLCGLDRYAVSAGTKLDSWDASFTFWCDPTSGRRLRDYLANDLAWFIVSQKLKSILKENQVEGIQYLPVNVRNEGTGESPEPWSLANTYNLIDALDPTHSTFVEYSLPGEDVYRFVRKHVLVRGRVTGIDIFRVDSHEVVEERDPWAIPSP